MTHKYIVYIGTGGLCHMLSGLSIAIKYAISHNRILVIDCLKLSSFKNKVSTYFDININNLIIQENYNDIIDDKFFDIEIKNRPKIRPTLIKGKGYFIDKYNISCFHNDQIDNKIIFYSGYGGRNINNMIKVNMNTLKIIENECNNLLVNNKKYISLHFRNTDRKHDINKFLNKIKNNRLKFKKENIETIFIATDDYIAFDKFKKNLNDFNCIRINIIEDCNGKNIHYHTSDKNKLVLDLLKDIYMILYSTYFIPSEKSGVSRWIIQMLNEKINIFNINTNCKLI